MNLARTEMKPQFGTKVELSCLSAQFHISGPMVDKHGVYMEWRLTQYNINALPKNLPQCNVVHHKLNANCKAIKRDTQQEWKTTGTQWNISWQRWWRFCLYYHLESLDKSFSHQYVLNFFLFCKIQFCFKLYTAPTPRRMVMQRRIATRIGNVIFCCRICRNVKIQFKKPSRKWIRKETSHFKKFI
jgi:hypothetical protein